MTKPRVIIPIVVQFSVRYAIRTGLLDAISDYAQPIVLLRWDEPELVEELQHSGIEVYPLPRTRCGVGYTRIKQQLDIWHLRQLQSPTTEIDRRRMAHLTRRSVRSVLRDALYNLNVSIPGTPNRLQNKFEAAIHRHTNVSEFEHLLRTLRADAVLSLTPYFQHEQLLLYAAKQHGLALCTSIISFDNITTRGWIPIIFDAYFLWNRYNAVELARAYPDSRSSEVFIVGAPQFDFYWDKTYLWDEQVWRQRLGLPTSRPVILFGAGHHLIVPHEPHWLQQIDEAIASAEIPGNPLILFRRHPNDPIDRWRPVLETARHVFQDEPWSLKDVDPAQTNIRRDDIERLASTLMHSQVHVNASSTMTVDGAIFDRPQIGPAYDDRPGRTYQQITQDLYRREHYLPITQSGGLEIVTSRDDLIGAIKRALLDPAIGLEGRSRIVKEICTYDDGVCTQRVSSSLKSILSKRDLLW